MFRLLSVLTFACLGLAACDTDTFEPPDQGPCERTTECPVNYVCFDGRCVLESTVDASDLDAGTGVETGTDAGSGEGSAEGSGDGSGEG